MKTTEVTSLLEIANTRHGPAALDEQPRRAGEHDHLADAEEARTYLRSRRMALPDAAPSPDELDRLRELRAAARAVARDGAAGARERLEGLLARYTYRLSADGVLVPTGEGWDGLVASALPGLLELMATDDRVHTCANPECDWLFIDRSRNHSRVWCDMGTCGSRAKMTRYRRRRRGS